MSESLRALARQLEQAIWASEPFQQLKQAYDHVRHDDTAYRLFANFRDIQLRLHEKQMRGAAILPDEIEQAQKAMVLAQQNEKLARLMALEQQMSMTIAEVQQIAMKPLEELHRSFMEGR
ncbi:YlbF family regulator [Geobacillus stearothermophilus]|uniref:YlbF family regulator n=1 Tax=Geobacillus stearothermophilus TaxID=1422 RepID=UPI001F28426B|nr:YlbF family regulator [Geobacillus stearothermophilus]MCK7605458.1 YlbF family regulator [Geobacillus stearothermophilus]